MSSSTPKVPFLKVQGTGNDFVVLDCLQPTAKITDPALFSRRVCDRHLGIGGDGLILIEVGASTAFAMRMFNPDGSESEMCGNGIRCFAVVLRELGLVQEGVTDVETGAGMLRVDLHGDRMTVAMGPARLLASEIGLDSACKGTFVDQPVGYGLVGTAVSMGNPHLVVFVDDVANVDLDYLGPELESFKIFPNRTNVHFAQVLDRNRVRQRTWERGAGPTLACGTGACATVVAGVVTGRIERTATVLLPGGELDIAYGDDGHVLMTGNATVVFTGEIGCPE